jgi:hypothetical protein
VEARPNPPPQPPPASEPSLNPTPEASEAALEADCCVWEERLPGERRLRRCDAPTAPGRPWCLAHLRAFSLGKALSGKTPFVRRGLH